MLAMGFSICGGMMRSNGQRTPGRLSGDASLMLVAPFDASGSTKNFTAETAESGQRSSSQRSFRTEIFRTASPRFPASEYFIWEFLRSRIYFPPR
jgi:hypothetical protein